MRNANVTARAQGWLFQPYLTRTTIQILYTIISSSHKKIFPWNISCNSLLNLANPLVPLGTLFYYSLLILPWAIYFNFHLKNIKVNGLVHRLSKHQTLIVRKHKLVVGCRTKQGIKNNRAIFHVHLIVKI